ncbi:MAG: bifunctional methylenetetrahydrofolate dehydrogenase/methenyltetrahydrofolate cyclohydrolase FolD [Pseudomonadota bacterium]
MPATRIDGKAIAKKVRASVAEAVATLSTRIGHPPGLAVILVGDDPASQVYVRNKVRLTQKVGMKSFEHRLPADTPQKEIEDLINRLNKDDQVDGILLQLPLPKGLNANEAIACIDPRKDVDGLTEVNAGKVLLGRKGLVPCTPQGAVLLTKSVSPDLTGKHAVVVGRSILVGKPLALLLQAENATVTMAHSRTEDLKSVCQKADILCAAVGRAEIIKAGFIKPGAIVIDVGINRLQAADGTSQLVGDVAYEDAADIAGAITPVPGGVGPMTIACLLKNTALAASRRRGWDDPAGF